MAGRLLEDFEKNYMYIYTRQKLEWLLPNYSTGSRPRFGVVTSKALGAQGRGSCARSSAHDSVSARPRLGQRERDLAEVGTK